MLDVWARKLRAPSVAGDSDVADDPGRGAVREAGLRASPPRFSMDNRVRWPRLHRVGGAAGLKGDGQARMQGSQVRRAVSAAMSTASSLDLTVDDVIVLHDSNKLTLRLLPCDVLARVALTAHQVAQFEIDLA